MTATACEWGVSTLMIFSDNVGTLVYYTHIFPLVISLFLGFQVLINNPRGLSNRVLFLLTLVFSAWVYFDLVIWAAPSAASVMFFWSAIVPIEMFMYLLAVYLVYLFAHQQKDPPTWKKIAFSTVLLPIFLFAHTSLNVIGLAPDCDTGAFEGILIQYMYGMETVMIIFVAYYLFKGRRTILDITQRRSHTYISTATFLFLLFFSAGNLTLWFELGPYYEQYKLFGMPVFAAIVSYCIIKIGAFRIRILLTEVLVSTLWILMFSMLLFREMSYARPFILLSVLAFAFLGAQLTKSARKEMEQKEQLQKLTGQLEKANIRLQQLDKLKSEFVSVASHQLRSPLAAIMGYSSMLSDGSYGKLPPKAQEVAERIEQSSRLMGTSVEDYLNVSRIESGQMKYNLSDFNIKEQAERVADDIRPMALKKNIILLFRTSMKGKGIVNADIGKTEQIMHNLINNSLKYTESGNITVIARDDLKDKKIFIDITDSGIGMSEETRHSIFQKFERGSNANSTNIHGTGLGLYTAAKLAEAMGGSISAHSEGEGKGSRFTIEFPLVS